MTREEEIKYASKDYVNYLLDKQEYHNINGHTLVTYYQKNRRLNYKIEKKKE